MYCAKMAEKTYSGLKYVFQPENQGRASLWPLSIPWGFFSSFAEAKSGLKSVSKFKEHDEIKFWRWILTYNFKQVEPKSGSRMMSWSKSNYIFEIRKSFFGVFPLRVDLLISVKSFSLHFSLNSALHISIWVRFTDLLIRNYSNF